MPNDAATIQVRVGELRQLFNSQLGDIAGLIRHEQQAELKARP